ncbi:MAG: adenylate kinase [Actinobacteria bacterium]|nr:adenylate kinase [Actinomycetota bacterium]MCL5770836.1 adenylate kinase [Actinomycetota bacterium]
MRLILLGAPGAGKGTQAKKISSKFNIPHVSTGDILRSEISSNSELGKKAEEYVNSGKLVPDELIIGMIKEEFKKDKFRTGFLMDGFPRTIEQAEKFSQLLKELNLSLNKVINIVVDEDEIVRRLTDRIVCKKCNKIFKLSDFSKEQPLKCDCGGELYKRNDDSEEVIKNRLEVYKKQTQPVVEYYKNSGLLENIDGLGTENEIFERILARL